MVVVCFCMFDDAWGLGWGARRLVAWELESVSCREAVLGGGVCKMDCWFGLEVLRLDCLICDSYFDRHRSVSEDGVG